MTTAGALTERIAFDEVVTGSDGGGGTIANVEERFVVWAARQFLRGGEGVQAARLEGKQPVLLTVRASSDTRRIGTAWRARDARTGESYEIRSVEPSADRAWIAILCQRGAG